MALLRRNYFLMMTPGGKFRRLGDRTLVCCDCRKGHYGTVTWTETIAAFPSTMIVGDTTYSDPSSPCTYWLCNLGDDGKALKYTLTKVTRTKMVVALAFRSVDDPGGLSLTAEQLAWASRNGVMAGWIWLWGHKSRYGLGYDMGVPADDYDMGVPANSAFVSGYGWYSTESADGPWEVNSYPSHMDYYRVTVDGDYRVTLVDWDGSAFVPKAASISQPSVTKVEHVETHVWIPE